MANDRFSDKAVMSARQVAEFDHAVERNGGTADDVKWLSSGTTLADVFKLRGGDNVIVTKAVLARIIPQFRALSDAEVPARLMEMTGLWRRPAMDLGYTGTIACLAPAGFHFKIHAPLSGPCYQQFQYLQDWKLRDEEGELTKRQLIFYIPRVVPESNRKTVQQQLARLAEFRQQYGLPEHHLTGFGTTSLLSGLMLTHHRLTQEKTPLGEQWVRTDTLDSDGNRLGLGGDSGEWLDCDRWGWGGGGSDGDWWAFPLGAEPLDPGELESLDT